MTPRWIPEPGELVVVWRDNGTAFLTTVREAGKSLSGSEIVWIHGISGYYALRCVRPVTIHPTAVRPVVTLAEVTA